MAFSGFVKFFRKSTVIPNVRYFYKTKSLLQSCCPPCFKYEGKVALVTGAGCGIGFACADALACRGIMGIVIADVSKEKADDAAKQLNMKYCREVCISKQLDVADPKQFDDTFQHAIEKFGCIDILINNAGILDEQNWEKMFNTNAIGLINGTLLGIEKYLVKHRSGCEAIIVNMSSILGLDPNPVIPIYASTTRLAIGLSRSYGAPLHYNKTKIRILTMCAGITNTALLENMEKKVRADFIAEAIPYEICVLPDQSAESCGAALLKMIDEGGCGSVWVAEAGEMYEVRTHGRNCRRVME